MGSRYLSALLLPDSASVGRFSDREIQRFESTSNLSPTQFYSTKAMCFFSMFLVTFFHQTYAGARKKTKYPQKKNAPAECSGPPDRQMTHPTHHCVERGQSFFFFFLGAVRNFRFFFKSVLPKNLLGLLPPPLDLPLTFVPKKVWWASQCIRVPVCTWTPIYTSFMQCHSSTPLIIPLHHYHQPDNSSLRYVYRALSPRTSAIRPREKKPALKKKL